MLNKIAILNVTIILLLNNSVALANGSYCSREGLGWHFYCDPKKKIQKTVKEPIKEETSLSPVEEIEKIQKELEFRKARAVLYPTKDNIISYLTFQQEQVNRASYFSDQWRRVLWSTPELDYNLKRPVATVAKQTWLDQRRNDIKLTIANLSEHYGIFFVFSSGCKFCHQYSPILKTFAEKYSLDVVAISIDGGRLPEWNKSIVNKGQLELLGIKNLTVPATFLFDNNTEEIIPVGFGILSHQELEQRIFTLVNLEVGDDY